MPPNPAAVSRYFSAQDGLKLHVREYGPLYSTVLPAVCLPGLSRTAEDFAVLATALARGGEAAPRRVLALDYRGRGLSDFDEDWRNYDVRVESNDVLAVLAACGIERAVFIGTSRGGLNTMLIGALRPTAIAAAVLNDIGPVLEPKGLARIRSYIGKLPTPKDYADAVDLLKHISANHFPSLGEADWAAFARLTFQETAGGLKGRYDQKLMKTLESLDLEAPLPDLWPQFEGLSHAPTLVLRGSHSDLLSQETALAMTKRHPDCQLYVVEGQGHAPLLFDDASIARIAAFIAEVEARVPA